ncbi:MAG: glycosyltransferase [Acidobacteria bacterium]|nr:glycosyltransferase [Acidobacteriota bacterium]MYD70284.1 glycosyltransferase [Acidobacteriota bacterium]MYJ04698.1 glycosyltransferase [Acidobacteriota bacterium]
MIINQWVPAAHQGDAVGDSARRVRRLLRERGHTSEIYALTIDDDLAGDIRPFTEAAARQGDATVLHFAVPSPMTEELTTLPGRTAIQYHNLTPAHFFAPWDAGLFRLMTIGRQELASLAGRVDLALGDSDYNRQELEALGFGRTGVMPIAVDTRRITGAPRMPVLERTLDDGFANILFVGRMVPQKKIEDLLKLGEHYKRYVDTEYRFLFVGRTDGVPGYYAALREMASRYRLPPQRFVFTGRVSDDELAAYYRMADAYVSLSEHEGFCVPLVEAMAADVPILAYGAAAVPETLGGAGVTFTPKDLEYAAELLGLLVYDDALRASVLAGQRRRLADFGAERIDRALDRMLDALTA